MIDNPLLQYAEVPDPRKAFECERCGEDIYVGEEYVYEDGEKLCTDCGSEDGEVRIAEERDYEG
jgi:formylmethanofuran dehydrogenase subunit E